MALGGRRVTKAGCLAAMEPQSPDQPNAWSSRTGREDEELGRDFPFKKERDSVGDNRV
jgi:hypothetical protein